MKTKGFLPKLYEIFGSEMPLVFSCVKTERIEPKASNTNEAKFFWDTL